jgi:hypothetical protein
MEGLDGVAKEEGDDDGCHQGGAWENAGMKDDVEKRERFVPLSVRMGQREPFGETVGVPLYLRHGLERWLDTWVENRFPYQQDQLAELIQAKLRLDLPDSRWWCLRDAMKSDPKLYLDVIDFVVSLSGEPDLQWLEEELLWEVAHEYRVDYANRRLVKRVDETVYGAYLKAATPIDQASELLREAWAASYAREGRDPAVAWDKAVAAVEAILAPIISPNDAKATLGKLRAALRDTPTRFECDIPHPDDSSGAEQLLAALGAIQFRPGRHGGDGRECDPAHSVATVLQAVTIIGWVREGLVRRLGE